MVGEPAGDGQRLACIRPSQRIGPRPVAERQAGEIGDQVIGDRPP